MSEASSESAAPPLELGQDSLFEQVHQPFELIEAGVGGVSAKQWFCCGLDARRLAGASAPLNLRS
jgi:hypothetical protein